MRLHPIAAAVYALADGKTSLDVIRKGAEEASGYAIDEATPSSQPRNSSATDRADVRRRYSPSASAARARRPIRPARGALNQTVKRSVRHFFAKRITRSRMSVAGSGAVEVEGST